MGDRQTAADATPTWFRLATARPTVVRSLKYAVVVGSVLIAINYWDRLASGDVQRGTLLRMALTAVVPYLVSTFASVSAIRGSWTPGTDATPPRGPSSSSARTDT